MIKDDFDFLIVNQRFPRLGFGIELRWGTKDLEPYIINLLTDTKGHTRMGFPTEIAEALNNLLMTHSKLYPNKRINDQDLWNSTFGDL